MTVEELLKNLKIKPRKMNLYNKAFTHATYVNEKKHKKLESYERLEFLGDILLSWMLSRHIYMKYHLDEGKMSLLRASLVKKDSLVRYTKTLQLDKCLITGRGGEKLVTNNGILSDIFESFIAALYLDLGYVQVEKILQLTIYKDLKEGWNKENKDFKTLLQEHLQSKNEKRKIEYVTFRKNNLSITQIIIKSKVYGTGTGEDKKTSQQEAARAALTLFKAKIETN